MLLAVNDLVSFLVENVSERVDELDKMAGRGDLGVFGHDTQVNLVKESVDIVGQEGGLDGQHHLWYLAHRLLAPSLHPLNRAFLVEGRIAFTVQRKVGIRVVHEQDDVKVRLDSCLRK